VFYVKVFVKYREENRRVCDAEYVDDHILMKSGGRKSEVASTRTGGDMAASSDKSGESGEEEIVKMLALVSMLAKYIAMPF